MNVVLEMELDHVDFAPSSTAAEIVQNVQTILTTPKYTVPWTGNSALMPACWMLRLP